IMAAINSTLTLPGIAGFVLTLGMAVDANVLINERIREELKTGRNIAAAVKTGYDKVFWTIFDGHVTALVAGFVIRAYGSGPVRGFATTLIIGLLASMSTSFVVTRAIVEWFVSHGRLHKAVSFWPRKVPRSRVMEMKYFDLIKPGTTHDFVKYRRIAVTVSLIVNALVLAGVIVWPGLNYGVDFAGGTELQVHFKKPVDPGEIRDLVGHQGFGEPTVQRYGNEAENQFLIRVERIALLTADKAQ